MESGVTLYWPETLGGSTSTSTCPLSNETMATRTCAVGGVWMPFDENSCSSFSGQLNDLVDLFSNVRDPNLVVSLALINKCCLHHTADNRHLRNSCVKTVRCHRVV